MTRKAVFGILVSAAQAVRVAERLKAAGFTGNDISVLLPDEAGSRDFASEKNTMAPAGAATGAGAGGIFGGGLGWLAGIGCLAIPGLGPFIAAGPIMAALGGAAVGAALGGLTGALVGMGIPELEAEKYQSKIRDGNILVSVHTDDSAQHDQAKTILEQEGACDVASAGQASVSRECTSEPAINNSL